MNLNQSWLPTAIAILGLIIFSEYAAAVPAISQDGPKIAENEIESGRGSSGEDGNWNVMLRMVEECAEKDMFQCLGVKAVTALERAARMADIQVLDGVSLVKSQDFDDGRNGRALASEEEIQNSLEQDPAQKTSRLVEYIVEAAARFFKSHVIQFKLPQFSPDQVQRAMQEARGKKKMLKALLPIILGVAAKLALVIPLGLGLVGFLAVKALLISKVALILAGAFALQKLFSGGGFGGFGGGKNGWSGGSGTGGWSSAGSTGGWSSGGNGGWSATGSGAGSPGYYRSFDVNAPVDAQEMAYKAQIPQQ